MTFTSAAGEGAAGTDCVGWVYSPTMNRAAPKRWASTPTLLGEEAAILDSDRNRVAHNTRPPRRTLRKIGRNCDLTRFRQAHDLRRQGGDRWRREQLAEGELYAECVADAGDQLHAEHRVTADHEKVVFAPDR